MSDEQWHNYLSDRGFCLKFQRSGCNMANIFTNNEKRMFNGFGMSGSRWATVWSDMLMLAKQIMDERIIND